MNDDRARLAAVEGLLDALDLITLVAGCAKPELSGPAARRYVESLTPEHVQRLACVLAIEAVWRLPLPAMAPRTAGDIMDRQRALQTWCWQRRSEVVAARRQIRLRAKQRAEEGKPGHGPRPPGGGAA